MSSRCLIVVAICLTTLFVLPPLHSQPPKSKGYLGLAVRGAGPLASHPVHNSKWGGRAVLISPRSAAEGAGLDIGDILVAVDNQTFKGPKKAVSGQFKKMLAGKKAGDEIVLTVLRPATSAVFQVKVALGRHPLHHGGSYRVPPSSSIFPQLVKDPPSTWQKAVEKSIAARGIEGDYRDLLRRLGRLQRSSQGFRRHSFAYVHRRPWDTGKVAEKIYRPLRDHSKSASDHLRHLAQLLDIKESLPLLAPLKTGISPKEHLDQIAHILRNNQRRSNRAFRRWQKTDRQWVKKHLPGLLEPFSKHIYIHIDKNRQRYQNNLHLLKLAPLIDYRPLVISALSLLRLSSPAYLKGLKEDLARSGKKLSQSIVVQRKTRWGKVVIGGTGENWHGRDKKKTAVIIDLGGDDFYSDRVGEDGIIVDISGNDSYESHKNWAQATGVLGASCLVDLDGNDSYIGMRGAQGCGFLGVGVLVDKKGNDKYRGQDYNQGCSLGGIGLLLDDSGKDEYSSHLYSQGVAIAGGVGAIVDRSGDDRYYCKGQVATSYGTSGVFSGWGQGVGVGFRYLASGGIGLVYDGGGRDHMEAGNFSQGGGYYHGWGLVWAGGKENDTYLGSRYCQGFSAHYAAGTFIEEGGDDTYLTRNAVAAGLAWDLSLTWFEDRGGNDTYPVKGFSVGAAAHNSFVFWRDMGGRDHYRYGPPGRPPYNSYHGGSSLAVVVDMGRDRDRYDRPGKRTGNDIQSYRKKHVFFIDGITKAEEIKVGKGK